MFLASDVTKCHFGVHTESQEKFFATSSQALSSLLSRQNKPIVTDKVKYCSYDRGGYSWWLLLGVP